MNKKIMIVIALLCIVIVGLFSSENTLRISGSSTILPIIAKAGQLFYRQTGIKIIVKGGGSGFGAKSTINGSIDIGTVSRDLKPEEQAKGLKNYIIGFDGIAIIVNKKNPLDTVETDTIVDIYTGQTSNWKTINQIDEEIILVSKEKGRSTGELFESFFKIEGKVIQNDNVFKIGSNFEDIAFVAGDPYAIGYVSIGTAIFMESKNAGIKLMKLDGIKPDIKNVANETYPLRRPLNLVTRGSVPWKVRMFINFILSDKGQQIVEDFNFIKVR